jgi:hypothetical protein
MRGRGQQLPLFATAGKTVDKKDGLFVGLSPFLNEELLLIVSEKVFSTGGLQGKFLFVKKIR